MTAATAACARPRGLVVAVLGLALAAFACGGESPQPPPEAAPDGTVSPGAAPGSSSDQPVPRRAATFLWPGKEAEGLQAREGVILGTPDLADQVRQVVGTLLGPPPDAAVVAPFPEGTRLTAAFVDERGAAYVSLSREVIDKAPGGSAWEQLAVHSLAGSLARSIPQVKRVQILVDGREIESLSGHLDLRAPITFDERLLAP